MRSSTSFAWLVHLLLTGQYTNYYPIMASSLPTFPRIVFTIIEPISLIAGFVGAVIDPAWFMNQQVPQSNVINPSENSIMVTWQLGNLYLLLGFLGIAILSTTNEISVVRAYLIALWLGDIGHVGFSSYGLGWDMSMSPAKWNTTTWGNIAMTLFLFLTRTAYFTGLFGKDHVKPFTSKKAI